MEKTRQALGAKEIWQYNTGVGKFQGLLNRWAVPARRNSLGGYAMGFFRLVSELG